MTDNLRKNVTGNPADSFRDVPGHMLISDIIRERLTNQTDVREAALEGLDLAGFKKILDIGCGFGFFTGGLAGKLGKDAEVTGIEQYDNYSVPYLETARKAGVKGKFIPDGISVIESFKENTYDLVLCSYSLYFFPGIIHHIARVLKNKGLLVIITHACPHLTELTGLVKEVLISENITGVSLLPYESLIERFSDTNAHDLLSPYFGSVSRKEFRSELFFGPSDLRAFTEFVRFKIPLLIPSGKGDEKKLGDLILKTVEDVIHQHGSFRITKDDAIFICSKPLRIKDNMKPPKRQYCPYCSQPLSTRPEGEVLRDYCARCDTFFYDNPLPVVSSIVLHERRILLVKRKYDPARGGWCLPMGFAETEESIEGAALRELLEETGLEGKIIGLVDVTSGHSEMYGDLIFITYEAEIAGGEPTAGDDASEVSYFPFTEMPELAFDANKRAVAAFLRSKQDYWAIIDSFSRTTGISGVIGEEYLSDKLIMFIEDNAETIGRKWLEDIRTNKTTHTYAMSDENRTYERTMMVIGQFSKWMGGAYGDQQVRDFYKDLGRARKKEGFRLSEVLSAISLLRKHIWGFALSNLVWTRTVDIYVSLELERRMILFFDRAAFYIAKGYEDEL